MPTPATPSAPTPKGDDRNLVSVDENSGNLSFEDRLRRFLEKNSTAVTVVLAAVVLAIAGKGGWEYLAAQREAGIEQAYAAATTPAELKVFAAAHPDHALAGVAQLQLADAASAAGKYGDAVTGYEQAAAKLKLAALASRARLGLAISKLQAGRTAEGLAALKAFASDANEIKAYRSEATYHLASQAFAVGNTAEVKTYTDQLMQIDPGSPWTQRGLQLRAEAPLVKAPVSAQPAITVPVK